MTLSSNISRRFMTSSYIMARTRYKRSNPGLSYQIDAIEDAAAVIQSDPEGFGELESDLFNAHQSHKQYELDVKRQNEKIKLHIVGRKYFRKDPLPNLLTYAEKEHIKFLHSSDAEEWNVDKLAESFPASTESIRKILKTNWSPLSSKRVLSHDENVLKNWQRFKNGDYNENMTTELKEHLKKFADGRENYKTPQNVISMIESKQWERPKSNEFSSIISSLRPKIVDSTEIVKLLETKAKSKDIKGNEMCNGTHLVGQITNKKPITIDQLKNKYLNESTKYYSDGKENIARKATNNCALKPVMETGDTSLCVNNAIDYTEKFISNEVIIDEGDKKRFEITATKHHIYIPRKLWRKGATYRANNCYYDDDGEFLYEVPGLALE